MDRLPTELLYKVFHSAADEDAAALSHSYELCDEGMRGGCSSSHPRTVKHGVRQVYRVCRRWRDLVLQDSRLWSIYIELAPNQPLLCTRQEDRYKEWLSHTENCDLDIVIQAFTVNSSSFLQLVVSLAKQWRTFAAYIPSKEASRRFNSALSQICGCGTLERLLSFKIKDTFASPTHCFTGFVSMPILEQLNLSTVAEWQRCGALPNLTTLDLKIGFSDTIFDWNALRLILSMSPNIQSLSLDCQRVNGDFALQPEDAIYVPHLTQLMLFSSMELMVRVLSLLRTTSPLALDMFGSEAEPIHPPTIHRPSGDLSTLAQLCVDEVGTPGVLRFLSSFRVHNLTSLSLTLLCVTGQICNWTRSAHSLPKLEELSIFPRQQHLECWFLSAIEAPLLARLNITYFPELLDSAGLTLDYDSPHTFDFPGLGELSLTGPPHPSTIFFISHLKAPKLTGLCISDYWEGGQEDSPPEHLDRIDRLFEALRISTPNIERFSITGPNTRCGIMPRIPASFPLLKELVYGDLDFQVHTRGRLAIFLHPLITFGGEGAEPPLPKLAVLRITVPKLKHKLFRIMKVLARNRTQLGGALEELTIGSQYGEMMRVI